MLGDAGVINRPSGGFEIEDFVNPEVVRLVPTGKIFDS